MRLLGDRETGSQLREACANANLNSARLLMTVVTVILLLHPTATLHAATAAATASATIIAPQTLLVGGTPAAVTVDARDVRRGYTEVPVTFAATASSDYCVTAELLGRGSDGRASLSLPPIPLTRSASAGVWRLPVARAADVSSGPSQLLVIYNNY